jgi:hypothetical protein
MWCLIMHRDTVVYLFNGINVPNFGIHFISWYKIVSFNKAPITKPVNIPFINKIVLPLIYQRTCSTKSVSHISRRG